MSKSTSKLENFRIREYKGTRGPRQLGNSQSSLSHCLKLALVMVSASFLPHEKISIRKKVLDDQKVE